MENKKITGKLFRIPFEKRFTLIDDRSHSVMIETAMKVDDIGIIVRHHKTHAITDDDVRRHLREHQDKYCIIEAGNVSAAIAEFYTKWYGANIGGEGEKRKALWINREKPIVELPYCERMWENKNGEFTCGEPDEENYGEFGMCLLEGYESLGETCPLNNFRLSSGHGKTEIIEISGVPFKVVFCKVTAKITV
ncbi:MAG TPA: hypothetical protein P5096_01475 [Patescibacteria group bacterium]|nr:hypothetical protein [Patescibacteria group bacterium]